MFLLQRVSKDGINNRIIITMPGIILSGGLGARTSVEVSVPSTGLSCSLPSLPDGRYGHTVDSLIICGGADYSASGSPATPWKSGGMATPAGRQSRAWC